MEEKTQQQTRKMIPPITQTDISSQNKKRPPSPRPPSAPKRRVDVVLGWSITIVCLWGAIVSFQRPNSDLFAAFCITMAARKDLKALAILQAFCNTIKAKFSDSPQDELPNPPGKAI